MENKPANKLPIPSDDLQTVLDHIASGTPLDPDLTRRVHERARKIRQEILDKQGILDVAVDLIRETRDDT